MKKILLKSFLLIIMLAFIIPSMVGCLVVEEMRFRFEFDNEDKDSGKFEIVYYGIKSSETEKNKIMEDYNRLLERTADEERELKKHGLDVKEKEIKVEGKEKLCGHLRGTFQKKDIFNKENSIFHESNEEIFLIGGISKHNQFRSNGMLLETEKNRIIVWPSSAQTLEWSIVYESGEKPNNLTEIYLKDKK